MKTLLALLVVSLAANGVLLVRRSVPDAKPVVRVHDADTRDGIEDGASSIPGALAPEAGSGVDVLGTSAWRAIDAPDLGRLVANLRAAGFPEADVHAVACAMVMDRYLARRQAMLETNGPRPYWRPQRGDGLSPEQRAELAGLARAGDETLREVFGFVPITESERRMNVASFGPLPDEKIRAIKRIHAEFSDLQREVFDEFSGGPIMPWDREKFAVIAVERRRELEAALTAEESELYSLYGPGLAQQMRRDLAGFEPTEAEFRAILAIRAGREADPNGAVLFDAAASRQGMEATRAAKEEIRALLGEARYAEYERALDPGYRRAAELVDRYRLPPANATAVHDLGREMETRAARVRADASLSPAARKEAFAALAREAGERLGSLLTPEGVAAFRAAGGVWLRPLESQGGMP